MEWGDTSILYALAGDFLCGRRPKEPSQIWKIEKCYKYTNGGSVNGFIGPDTEWNTWITVGLRWIPRYCAMFIPRAADFSGLNPPKPSQFTSITIPKSDWNKAAPLLYIPSYYADVIERNVSSVLSVYRPNTPEGPLRMQIGITTPEVEDGFAFAATHFQSRRFTSAIMVGCTHQQVEYVKRLVSSFKDSHQHPLLILGLFAELELRRLEKLVGGQKFASKELKDKLDDTQREEDTANPSWNMIGDVLKMRDEFQGAEMEVDAAKRQLVTGCIRQIQELQEEYERNLADPKFRDHARAEKDLEVTRLFSERFHDIVSRLEGIAAQCRLRVESISVWTDLIQSNLARKEANTSAQNTKIATIIAFAALVYLPITGVATILAMPIFGWTNDWKNLKFQSVGANDQPNGTSPDSGPANSTGTGLPVVSGYIWVYIAISVLAAIPTLLPFIIFIYKPTAKKVQSQPKAKASTQLPTGLV
ncbi:hypothetical protein F4803DRAFT_568561 [Xylaria telfairii]|nr:hypothetical protein F4803DRAFT_568561 [Xylaria telfairii]